MWIYDKTRSKKLTASSFFHFWKECEKALKEEFQEKLDSGKIFVRVNCVRLTDFFILGNKTSDCCHNREFGMSTQYLVLFFLLWNLEKVSVPASVVVSMPMLHVILSLNLDGDDISVESCRNYVSAHSGYQQICMCDRSGDIRFPLLASSLAPILQCTKMINPDCEVNIRINATWCHNIKD